jgi:hypothetical protein
MLAEMAQEEERRRIALEQQARLEQERVMAEEAALREREAHMKMLQEEEKRRQALIEAENRQMQERVAAALEAERIAREQHEAEERAKAEMMNQHQLFE